MEFFYGAIIPLMGITGHIFQAEIRDYFTAFTFHKNWHEIAMFIITLCIVIMTIAIVEFTP